MAKVAGPLAQARMAEKEEPMKLTEAFRRYGVELTNPLLTSSTVSENPHQVIHYW